MNRKTQGNSVARGARGAKRRSQRFPKTFYIAAEWVQRVVHVAVSRIVNSVLLPFVSKSERIIKSIQQDRHSHLTNF